MNNEQMQLGKLYLAGWLLNEEVLKKKPSKIEFAFEFDNHDIHYYVYKFKKTVLGKWLVGICGFDGDSNDNIGHVLSGLEEYEDDSVHKLTMAMTEFLHDYTARNYMQCVFENNLKYISGTELAPDKIARQFVKSETRDFLTVGTVDVKSGKVVVADPISYMSGSSVIAPVLKREIPCGSYPAEISVCRHDVIGMRYCTARLKIRSTAAVRYELAEVEEESSAFKASDGAMSGFPVDAGMMCFVDAEAAENYKAFINRWHEENPDKNHYADYLAAFFSESAKAQPQYQRELGDFIQWVNPGTGERMVQITSGFGDGFYMCFWGFDSEGEVCELIVPMIDPDIYDG